MRKHIVFLMFASLPSCAGAQYLLVVDDGRNPQSLIHQPDRISVVNTTEGGLEIRGGTDNPSISWGLELSPPPGDELRVGCFERATKFPTLTRPTLKFNLDFDVCQSPGIQSFSRYRVLQIERDALGEVTQLAVDFSEQCRWFSRAMQGKLRFNSDISTAGDHLRTVRSPSGSLTFTAEPNAVGASAPNGSATFQISRPAVSARIRNFNVPTVESAFQVLYEGPLVPTVLEGQYWDLTLAGPNTVPLAVGHYPNVTRFNGGLQAGMSFIYGKYECGDIGGSFDITAVETDALDGQPLRLNATFQQSCRDIDASGPVTSGSIDYEANIIGPTSEPGEFVFDSGFEVDLVDPPSYFASNCH